jgi:hypothetical protein
MIRLNIIVEGKTEATFVRRVLAPHLGQMDISAAARQVAFSKGKGVVHKGGIRDYAIACADIAQWLKEDRNPDARFSTMFDLYALPTSFPGYAEAEALRDSPLARVTHLERCLDADLGDRRLLSYLQLHEFEALLFSDARALMTYFPHAQKQTAALAQIADSFPSPEYIDDGPATSPSKRIIAMIPEYAHLKASAGPVVASHIGLDVIRSKCPHFNDWITGLETLAQRT